MLKMAGDISKYYDLWMQTHLSENTDEVEIAQNLFPDINSYLGIYDHFGLLHQKSLFAHCIYVQEEEWKLFCEKGAVVSHNPDSNFFQVLDVCPLLKLNKETFQFAMGSDVGAGRSFSLRIAGGRFL